MATRSYAPLSISRTFSMNAMAAWTDFSNRAAVTYMNGIHEVCNDLFLLYRYTLYCKHDVVSFDIVELVIFRPFISFSCNIL